MDEEKDPELEAKQADETDTKPADDGLTSQPGQAEVGLNAGLSSHMLLTKGPENKEVGFVATTEAVPDDKPLPKSQHPNDVKFLVKYSASYKGDKPMPEGVTIVSKESADHFIKLGIGKIVK